MSTPFPTGPANLRPLLASDPKLRAIYEVIQSHPDAQLLFDAVNELVDTTIETNPQAELIRIHLILSGMRAEFGKRTDGMRNDVIERMDHANAEFRSLNKALKVREQEPATLTQALREVTNTKRTLKQCFLVTLAVLLALISCATIKHIHNMDSKNVPLESPQ